MLGHVGLCLTLVISVTWQLLLRGMLQCVMSLLFEGKGSRWHWYVTHNIMKYLMNWKITLFHSQWSTDECVHILQWTACAFISSFLEGWLVSYLENKLFCNHLEKTKYNLDQLDCFYLFYFIQTISNPNLFTINDGVKWWLQWCMRHIFHLQILSLNEDWEENELSYLEVYS